MMDALQLQQIVEAVTCQVMANIQKGVLEAAADEGKEKLLIIGDPSRVPATLTQHKVVCNLEDYEKLGNINRYHRVLIEKLTLTQLVDISMGRVADSASCAVTQAFLHGVDVWMLETALPHRTFAGKCNSGFYQMLEGYVQKLLVFGVKLLGEDKVCPKAEKPAVPAKFQAPAAAPVKQTGKPNADRLITETVAVKMLDQADGTVELPAGTILTPSALDVFKQAGVKIQRRA